MGFVQPARQCTVHGKNGMSQSYTSFLPRASAEAFFPFPLGLSSGDSEKTGPKSTVEAL